MIRTAHVIGHISFISIISLCPYAHGTYFWGYTHLPPCFTWRYVPKAYILLRRWRWTCCIAFGFLLHKYFISFYPCFIEYYQVNSPVSPDNTKQNHYGILSGKTNDTFYNIDLSNWTNGCYLISIKNVSGKNIVKKFIVQHWS